MASYKVWLTVKDSKGNLREVDGGTMNFDLSTLVQNEIDHIEEALPLENYVTKTELATELTEYTTDAEVTDVVEAVQKEIKEAVQSDSSMCYSDFKLRD